MSTEPKIQTWSAIIIGDSNGLLSHPDDPLSGYPGHYERSMLVRKIDYDQAIRDLNETRKELSDFRDVKNLCLEIIGRQLGIQTPCSFDDVIKATENISQPSARVEELEKMENRYRWLCLHLSSDWMIDERTVTDFADLDQWEKEGGEDDCPEIRKAWDMTIDEARKGQQ